MLVDKKRKCLERARSVSKLVSMIAVIAPTITKKTTGTFHDHTIYFCFKNVYTDTNLSVYVKLQVLFQLHDAFRNDNFALKLMCWTDFT